MRVNQVTRSPSHVGSVIMMAQKVDAKPIRQRRCCNAVKRMTPRSKQQRSAIYYCQPRGSSVTRSPSRMGSVRLLPYAGGRR